MQTPDFDSLFKQFKGLLPDGSLDLQKDLEKNMRAAFNSTLKEMNLVTREEFELQTAVLQRTREKLEQLGAQLAALEAQQLTPADSANSSKDDETAPPQS